MTTVLMAEQSALAASEKVLARLNPGSAGARRSFTVYDPADGSALARVPDIGGEQAIEALARADAAGRAWAVTTPRHRADVLRRWYDLIAANAEDIALLITREMGKPLAEARAEVTYGSDFVRWYAEEAVRPAGNVRDAPSGGGRLFTRRAPVGLSVLITPWNFPLAMATRKIAPALAVGCSALIKPAALTPLTTLLAVQLATEAGVPADLVQVMTTSDASGFSTAVLADPRVRKGAGSASRPRPRYRPPGRCPADQPRRRRGAQGCGADADVVTTEIFGLIAAIQRFATETEAVTRANDTAFGLAGYVFTQDLDRAFNVADRLEAGLVGINQGVPSSAAAPFGGVKQSGLGRESSGEGLEEYQEIRR